MIDKVKHYFMEAVKLRGGEKYTETEGDVRTEKCQGRLTVYFEDPFWVGVFERIENRKLSVAKATFGVKPKDYDVLEFINRNYYHLQFSPASIVRDLILSDHLSWLEA